MTSHTWNLKNTTKLVNITKKRQIHREQASGYQGGESKDSRGGEGDWEVPATTSGRSRHSGTRSHPTLCDLMEGSTPGSLTITNSQSLDVSSDSRPLGRWCHPTTSSCRPLLLPPSILPSTRVFFNESVFCIGWPMHQFQLQLQSFQWTFRTDLQEDWLVGSPCSPRDPQEFSNTTVQKHQFFSAQFSLWSNSHIHTRLLEKL